MFTIRAFINEGVGRFLAFTPGDELVRGPVLRPEAAGDHDALDRAWVAGNRMDPEHPWPSEVRSLSVGDVLVVRVERDPAAARAYAVAPFGFAALDAAALVDAFAFGLPKAS